MTAQIVVTAPSGSLLTCGIQTYQLGADETQHTFSVALGSYTVSATDGTRTATQDVLVDAVGIFSVTLEFKLWLYRDGEEFTEITGGWVLVTSGGYFGGSAVKNTDHILITPESTSYKDRTGTYVKNALSLGAYTKLCADVEISIPASNTEGVNLLQMSDISFSNPRRMGTVLQAFSTAETAPSYLELTLQNSNAFFVGLQSLRYVLRMNRVWLE